MHFDELLERHLGQFGRYQKFVFLLGCLVTVPGAWNTLGIVFLAGVPDHRCAIPELDNVALSENIIRNISIPPTADGFSQCTMYDKNYTDYVNSTDGEWALLGARQSSPVVPCKHGWKYSTDVYTSTIVSKWDLICEHSVLRATASSIYMAGVLTGVIVTGIFSDICGRRPAFIVCLVLMIFSNIGIAFSPNFTAFSIIRFITGFSNIGLFTTAFVIAMEFVGPAYRVHVGIAIEYPWALGYMVYALIAYGLRDWFTLHLATQGPMVLLLIIIFLIPESPRWLYMHNQPEKGKKTLEKLAKWNKTKLPKDLEITVIQQEKGGYIWDILRTPRMRLRSLIVFYIWFVNSVVYYGLSLGTSSMGGNDFVNFFVAGAVEIPAYIGSQVALVYLGRKLPLAGTMAVGGVALLVTMFIPSHLTALTITLAMLGKFCISASFAIIYVHTAEMFPTVVRQAALSSASLCSRVGGITAPYIGLLSEYGAFIPLLLFGVLSLVAAGLTLFLPETKGKRLPETIADGENFGRGLGIVFPRGKRQPNETNVCESSFNEEMSITIQN